MFSGELAHALRFLASVVSQSFLAFGDILELHRKFLELSGGINRIFELEELLYAVQSGTLLIAVLFLKIEHRRHYYKKNKHAFLDLLSKLSYLEHLY